MFIKTIKHFAVLSLIFMLASSSAPKDQNPKNQILLKALIYGLSAGHYDVKQLNDKFSEQAFDLFLRRIDYQKFFLLEEDVKEMEKYKYFIDDEINAASYQLLGLTSQILAKRIAETETQVLDIFSKPFDFKTKESYEADPKKYQYVKNAQERYDRWRKDLKYRVLVQYQQLLQQNDNLKKEKEAGNAKDAVIKTEAELEKESRESLEKNYKEYFTRLKAQDQQDWLEDYLNAITSTYDPHTNYFAPKEREDFNIEMTGQLEGIGASLISSEGYIKIAAIVEGSPCWRQGELAVGDIILKAAQAEAEPTDLVGMRVDKAVTYIRGKKGTEVRLTLKKKEGTIKTISIIRDVIVFEETYAKSAVLKSEAGKKIGYIYLPKFYANFENPAGRQCFQDVKTEIQKLKKDNVEGIILDLRNNGGGSLQDVVNMTGLFIPNGPVVQVKSRDVAPQILSDPDPNTDYDGDLAIMVNQNSASASEIIAAALQDYKRAVIVGSNATFGKGTVQRMIDLDNFLDDNYKTIKPLGALKITLQKFYRIDGSTTQLKGVIPDVILPDVSHYLKVGEKDQDYAMAWDQITPLTYTAWANSPDIAFLKKRSEERLAKSEAFKAVDQYAKRLKKQSDLTSRSLSLEGYKADLEQNKKENESYGEAFKTIKNIETMPLEMDRLAFGSDSVKIKKNQNWLNSLQKDVYLQETLKIMDDMKIKSFGKKD